MKAAYTRYILDFKVPGGTSRGILTQKETWFVRIWHDETPWIFGIGECALFRGLSADDRPGYEEKLKEICEQIDTLDTVSLRDWSSIRFGVETALLDLKNGGRRKICPGAFYEGKQSIEINGLIWMGDKEAMYSIENVKEIELAYAMTVHKSQGSEFAAVVLPTIAIPPKLSYRNLFYTALTRARNLLIIVGNEASVKAMVDNDKKSRRYSALVHFLSVDNVAFFK